MDRLGECIDRQVLECTFLKHVSSCIHFVGGGGGGGGGGLMGSNDPPSQNEVIITLKF